MTGSPPAAGVVRPRPERRAPLTPRRARPFGPRASWCPSRRPPPFPRFPPPPAAPAPGRRAPPALSPPPRRRRRPRPLRVDPTEQTEAPPPLRAASARGFLWTGGQAIFNRGLSLVGFVVLARLLGPHDYGLVALANVFVFLL